MTTQANKETAGKPRLDLIPPEFIFATGAALTYPVTVGKYDARNWELGTDWCAYFAAHERHMWAWMGGEEADPDSGLSHLAHAAACLAILIGHEARGIGTDDRPNLAGEIAGAEG